VGKREFSADELGRKKDTEKQDFKRAEGTDTRKKKTKGGFDHVSGGDEPLKNTVHKREKKRTAPESKPP